MTERDFELTRCECGQILEPLAARFANALAKDNPRFDREKFLKACAE